MILPNTSLFFSQQTENINSIFANIVLWLTAIHKEDGKVHTS